MLSSATAYSVSSPSAKCHIKGLHVKADAKRLDLLLIPQIHLCHVNIHGSESLYKACKMNKLEGEDCSQRSSGVQPFSRAFRGTLPLSASTSTGTCDPYREYTGHIYQCLPEYRAFQARLLPLKGTLGHRKCTVLSSAASCYDVYKHATLMGHAAPLHSRLRIWGAHRVSILYAAV